MTKQRKQRIAEDDRSDMEARRNRAIAMYQQGRKTRDITAETGIERANLYALLRSRGLIPNRQRRSDADPDWTLQDAMRALQQAYVEQGRLQAEVDRLRAMLNDAGIDPDE